MLIVIPCGNSKRNGLSRADRMYTGGYHKMCLKFARSLVDDNEILILSAKYGFIRLDTVIMPYDVSFTKTPKKAITIEELKDQISYDGLVVALGGKAYTEKCKAVFPHCVTPLPTKTIGYQVKWMNNNLGTYDPQKEQS